MGPVWSIGPDCWPGETCSIMTNTNSKCISMCFTTWYGTSIPWGPNSIFRILIPVDVSGDTPRGSETRFGGIVDCDGGSVSQPSLSKIGQGHKRARGVKRQFEGHRLSDMSSFCQGTCHSSPTHTLLTCKGCCCWFICSSPMSVERSWHRRDSTSQKSCALRIHTGALVLVIDEKWRETHLRGSIAGLHKYFPFVLHALYETRQNLDSRIDDESWVTNRWATWEPRGDG